MLSQLAQTFLKHWPCSLRHLFHFILFFFNYSDFSGLASFVQRCIFSLVSLFAFSRVFSTLFCTYFQILQELFQFLSKHEIPQIRFIFIIFVVGFLLVLSTHILNLADVSEKKASHKMECQHDNGLLLDVKKGRSWICPQQEAH